MTAPDCIEISKIRMHILCHEKFPLDRSYAPLGTPFICDGENNTSCNIINMHFDCNGAIAAHGEILLSLNDKTLFQHDSGFLVQQFIPGDEKRPLLSIEINKQYTNLKFHFDCDRYLFCYPGQYKKINSFSHATDQLLLHPTFLNNHGIAIHSSGGFVQDKGLIFAAPSGTGKSTLAHLLLSHDNRLFSEERIIARHYQGTWTAWGTPWHGSGNIARNESAPLAALIFLSQAPETKITELSPSKALHRLLQVASILWYSEEWTQKGLDLCEQLIQEIPAYELAFTPDQSAVRAVEQLAAAL